MAFCKTGSKKSTVGQIPKTFAPKTFAGASADLMHFHYTWLSLTRARLGAAKARRRRAKQP